MDAFTKIGIICAVFTLLIGTYLFLFKIGFAHGFWLMAIVLFLIGVPLMWIGGLNTIEFISRPFVEKGMKGFFSWVITIILATVVYCVIGAVLYYLFLSLQLF